MSDQTLDALQMFVGAHRPMLGMVWEHLAPDEHDRFAQACMAHPAAFVAIAADVPAQEMAAWWQNQPTGFALALRLEAGIMEQAGPSHRSHFHDALDFLDDIMAEQDLPPPNAHELSMLPESLLKLIMKDPDEIGTRHFDPQKAINDPLSGKARTDEEIDAARDRLGKGSVTAEEVGEWASDALTLMRQEAYQTRMPLVRERFAPHLDADSEHEFVDALPDMLGSFERLAQVERLADQLEEETSALLPQARSAVWRGAVRLLLAPEAEFYQSANRHVRGFIRLSQAAGEQGLPAGDDAFDRAQASQHGLELLDRYPSLSADLCLQMLKDAPRTLNDIGHLDRAGKRDPAALGEVQARLTLLALRDKAEGPSLNEMFALEPEELIKLLRNESGARSEDQLARQELRRAWADIARQRPRQP